MLMGCGREGLLLLSGEPSVYLGLIDRHLGVVSLDRGGHGK